MNTSLEYRLMCMKATEIQDLWEPQVGDYLVSKASYCYNGICEPASPCNECLEMSNVYVVSGKYDFHESIGGTHWYYGGHSCGRGHGSLINSTGCYVMNRSGHNSSQELDYEISAVSEHLWLPRLDQIQEMLFKGSNCYEKTMYFVRWIDTNKYYMSDESPEELWLKYLMEKQYNKKWRNEGKHKFWEE
ncbi:hypothetical protein [Paenibacillus sp. NAIST15-1]|uniref:hypothetical protein n=1 Tax=Paenibacillus sp. NAIST15-1 TaxID=1605994 RepID=UPI00086A6C9F|nr:hypothetical protein [Paenibacillus sp. NAIST15-1]GAV11437.1 hypothetical protein PBN151_1366 [Paenibacillus sp. NAIST15-1]